ncbi:Cytoplasmic protein NCK1 [Halotydeus destructor]|nr:Cytoplasmic protein NCK1 [Halotydeus destructor]
MGKGSGDEVYVVAKYDYVAQGSQELDLKKNEKLILLDDSKHWWKVLNSKSQSGFVPSNYVKKEKPSIFDSIRKKVKRRSESKSNLASPVSSPIAAKSVDININGSPNHSSKVDDNAATSSSAIQTFALVKYNYEAQQVDELSLVKGSRLTVLEKSSDGWWKGELGGLNGWFPSNYVQEEPLSPLRIEPRTTSRKASLEQPPPAPLMPTNGHGVHNSNGTNGSATKSPPPSIRLPILDVVIALYSFASQNEEELSFEKGERLEIIERPANDPDWWLARSKSNLTGLVPKNYVQVISDKEDKPLATQKEMSKLHLENSSPKVVAKQKHDEQTGIDFDVTLQSWYFGCIPRSQCDSLLNEFAEDGDFLIRDSETNSGDFSVSLKAPGRNKHFRVHFENGVYAIGQRRFSNLYELIEHYKKAPIYTSPKGEKMYLIKPFSRPQL